MPYYPLSASLQRQSRVRLPGTDLEWRPRSSGPGSHYPDIPNPIEAPRLVTCVQIVGHSEASRCRCKGISRVIGMRAYKDLLSQHRDGTRVECRIPGIVLSTTR